MSGMSRSRVLRWAGLVVGCINIATSGSILSFNSYANDIKDVFNLTQSQVELMASIGMIGSSVGYPAGVFFENVGPAWTFFAATLLGCGASILIGMASYFTWFSTHAGLLYTYAFIFGLSSILMYLSPLTVNMVNFKLRHRGKIVGLTGACWWLGPAIFALIYGKLFAPTKNIGGYFFTLACIILTVNVLAVIFIRYIPQDTDTKEEPIENNQTETGLVTNETENSALFPNSPQNQFEFTVDTTGIKLLKSVDFHLITWSFLFIASTGIMYINNIAVYLKSYDMDNLIVPLTVSGPVVAAMFKFIGGALSDEVLFCFPRSTFLAVFATLQTVFLTVCITQGDSNALFITTSYVMYAANGTFYSVVPLLISDFFGMLYFSRNWGILILGYALLGLGFSGEFGYVYDDHTDEQHLCFGNECFTDSYVLGAVASFIGMLLLLVLLWKEAKLRYTNRTYKIG